MQADVIKAFNNLKEIEIYPGSNNVDREAGEIIFPVNKLNDSTFKRMVLYYDSILTSPLEYIITSTLAALSGAIGRNAFFQITESKSIYLNIYAVLIGPSTIMRKTTAMDTCIYDLQVISEAALKKYNKEYSEYQQKLSEVKDNKSKLVIPAPRREQLIYPSNSTVEALTDILAVNSRGIMIHNEFGSFLSQLNKSYSADAKQFLTAIYDVPRIYEVVRATKQNTVIITPFLSFLAATTIDWIQENSQPSDLRTGFFARFLFSIKNTPDKPFTPLLKLKYKTKESEYYINTREIFEYLTSINTSIVLDINKAAEEIYNTFEVDSHHKILELKNDSEMSFKARLDTYALKFAGLIALTDRRTVVTKNDIDDGVLLAEYYKKNVERLLNNEMTRTESGRKEQKILELISRKSEEEVIRHSFLLQLSNLNKKELKEIISTLLDKEEVEILQEEDKRRIVPDKKGIYYRLTASGKKRVQNV